MHGGPKAIKMLLGDLPPIYDKNPLIAAVLGFCFGGVGLGLYFLSWKDFLYPILVAILFLITFNSFLPVVGTVPAMLLGSLSTAAWGAYRASD